VAVLESVGEAKLGELSHLREVLGRVRLFVPFCRADTWAPRLRSPQRSIWSTTGAPSGPTLPEVESRSIGGWALTLLAMRSTSSRRTDSSCEMCVSASPGILGVVIAEHASLATPCVRYRLTPTTSSHRSREQFLVIVCTRKRTRRVGEGPVAVFVAHEGGRGCTVTHA
jgi:hypothetical protein